MTDTSDILLSQRFLPEHGGSIRWMHEAYRRWPLPVDVITHDYKTGSDPVLDANLRMDRRDIFMDDWGVESLDRILRYARMTGAVNEKLKHARGTVRIHCTHAVPEVVSLVPLRWRYGKRMKVICYAHGEEITACESSRQLRLMMRKAYNIVDIAIANSHYTAGLLSRHIDPAKITVVHPGVDLGEFENADNLGNTWRRQHGYEDRLIVLTLGRLDPRKNHAAVIDAVAQLAAKHPSLLYVIAGEGRQMDALKAQARDRGIEDRVMFAGAVDGETRLALYGACDVFAMPAIQDGTDVEGFGMVFLEAGACHTPSLAGTVGGQSDAVRDGETGYIVDGTDTAAVTAKLDGLLSNAASREKLGRAARTYAEGFDWPRIVERTVELVGVEAASGIPLSAAQPS